MAIYEFDSLVESFGSVFDSTRKSIDTKQQGMLKRLFEEDSDGKTQAITWIFSVPSKKDPGGYEDLKLPLLSLRSTNSLRISKLSIEFDSKIKVLSENEQRELTKNNLDTTSTSDVTTKETSVAPEEVKQKSSKLKRMVMWVRKWKKTPQKDLERVTISYRDDDLPKGEVRVNDQLLKEIELTDEP